MSKMLTLQAVATLAVADEQSIRNYCTGNGGFIEPTVRGAAGRGFGHRFSVPLAVGIAVAEQIRRGRQGSALSYYALICAAFGAMSEEALVARLKRRDRFFAFATMAGNRPVVCWDVADEWDERIDVKTLFDEAVRYSEEARPRAREMAAQL
jgi:hypothetical protein